MICLNCWLWFLSKTDYILTVGDFDISFCSLTCDHNSDFWILQSFLFTFYYYHYYYLNLSRGLHDEASSTYSGNLQVFQCFSESNAPNYNRRSYHTVYQLVKSTCLIKSSTYAHKRDGVSSIWTEANMGKSAAVRVPSRADYFTTDQQTIIINKYE